MKVQGLSVKKASEPWTEYLLEDGTTLRLRIVLLDVGRAVDTFDEAENPIYQFKHTMIVDIKVPDKLKRKK